jgi:hypothetical protein
MAVSSMSCRVFSRARINQGVVVDIIFRSPVPKHGYIDEYISVAISDLLYIDADSMMSASTLSSAGMTFGRERRFAAPV